MIYYNQSTNLYVQDVFVETFEVNKVTITKL